MAAKSNIAFQPSFPGLCPVTAAVETMASAGVEERGAIFTKREVVDFILDLAGYTIDRPLYLSRILEPSFGGGDFLLPIIARLVASYRKSGGDNGDIVNALATALCGVELHQQTFDRTRDAVVAALREEGVSKRDAEALARSWLRQGDFLLSEFEGSFTHVVGNPPYVRQELIPDVLMEEYRKRFSTVYDRADIYIPFIERALGLLSAGGVVGFICADRWMKNRYGGPLRRLIAGSYNLRTYVDMVDAPAFTSDVIAYPGIFLIANEAPSETRVAKRPEIDSKTLTALAKQLSAKKLTSGVKSVHVAAQGDAPWVLEHFGGLELLRDLESRFPTIEEAGCRVGIGVATGADKAFIGPYADLPVEEDRKLPLVMTRDIASGTLTWRGFGVINPFNDDGGLVPLSQYPKLKHYLEARRDEIAGRHVAKKAPANWYRTIDRIYPSLVGKPKLLIPDIKGSAHIVLDDGDYYPHHNLYFITSEAWDIRALRTVLRSGIARLFVSAYSTKMRGGYLRFQAQYLRRIRLPEWSSVPKKIRTRLIQASNADEASACDDAVAALYNIGEADMRLLTQETTTAP